MLLNVQHQITITLYTESSISQWRFSNYLYILWSPHEKRKWPKYNLPRNNALTFINYDNYPIAKTQNYIVMYQFSKVFRLENRTSMHASSHSLNSSSLQVVKPKFPQDLIWSSTSVIKGVTTNNTGHDRKERRISFNPDDTNSFTKCDQLIN